MIGGYSCWLRAVGACCQLGKVWAERKAIKPCDGTEGRKARRGLDELHTLRGIIKVTPCAPFIEIPSKYGADGRKLSQPAHDGRDLQQSIIAQYAQMQADDANVANRRAEIGVNCAPWFKTGQVDMTCVTDFDFR